MRTKFRRLQRKRRFDSGVYIRGLAVGSVLIALGIFLLSLGYRTFGTFPFENTSLALFGVGGVFVIVGYCLLTNVILFGTDDGYYY